MLPPSHWLLLQILKLSDLAQLLAMVTHEAADQTLILLRLLYSGLKWTVSTTQPASDLGLQALLLADNSAPNTLGLLPVWATLVDPSLTKKAAVTSFWVTCPGAIANATKTGFPLFTPETRSLTLTHGSREKCKEFTVFSEIKQK